MISVETEKRLSMLLVSIGEQEREVEVMRQVLCEQPLFETYSAFQRIDRNRRQYLSERDVYKFVSANNSVLTERQITMIIRFYDTSHEGKMSYIDFLNLVLPKDCCALRAKVCQRPIYEVTSKDNLSYDVEYSLCRLIEKEGNTLKDTEKIKEKLTTRFDFNAAEAFKCIDRENKKYITYKDIAKFLSKTGHTDHNNGIEFMYNRLDLNRDGFLSYNEFVKAFAPLNSNTRVLPNYASPTRNSLAQVNNKHVKSEIKQMNKSFSKAYCSVAARYKDGSAIAKPKYRGSSKQSTPMSQSFYQKPYSKVTAFSVYSYAGNDT